MWLVRRKSGNTEFYNDFHDFNSWTRVDLSELSNVAFTNPSSDAKSTHFKIYLENQVKKGFPDMKTVESIIKQFPGILDLKTNLPFQAMMWPATNQVK